MVYFDACFSFSYGCEQLGLEHMNSFCINPISYYESNISKSKLLQIKSCTIQSCMTFQGLQLLV
jgi:hypothetical protein